MSSNYKEIIPGQSCEIVGGDIGIDPDARKFLANEIVTVKRTKAGLIQVALVDDPKEVYSVAERYLRILTIQKFNKGDHVRVDKELGSSMSHFESDCEAIIEYSYYDRYGGGKESTNHSYSIFIKGKGSVSWYYESQLTLIEANRSDLLVQWEEEAEAFKKEKSDLDWIFANGKEVIEKRYGASIQSLADCLGFTNLWGSRGEGYVYVENSLHVLRAAVLFLLNSDKAGWLSFAEEFKAEVKI